MRVSFKDFNSKIAGDEELKEGKVAGVNDYRNEAQQPLDPFEIQDLKTKRFYSTTQKVEVHVAVELWNLYTRKKFFLGLLSYK